MFNIISYNVNGLRDFQKRKKIFNHLKEIHKADIVLLQETHCVQADQLLWENQWGGKMINSFGETNARGVSFLVGRNVECEIVRQARDDEGRYVVIEIKHNEKEIVIAGLYAPNRDTPDFFRKVFKEINNFQNGNIILAGDFNLVLDEKLDRAGTSEFNYPKSRDLVLTYMEEMELCDLWRVRNPEVRRYSCHRKNSKFFSRIDLFLVSCGLTQYIRACSINASYNSDHAILKLVCNFTLLF